MVDAGNPEQGLIGFDLINLVDEDAHCSDEDDESASSNESEEDVMSDNQSESDSCHLSSRLHRSARTVHSPKKHATRTSAKALLLQQSHRGDVFAQRVTWGVNPFRQARLGLLPAGPVGSSASQTGVAGLSTNAASLVAGAVSKKAPQRKPLKRKRPAHYLDSDDEEEEEESEDEVASLKNTTSGNEQGKGIGIGLPHSESRGLPPVQLNLPCGVRCYPPENTAVLSNTTSASSSSGKEESALKATKKYLKTVIRNNGLILLNAISANDSNLRASVEQQQQTHFYPSSCSAFPDFVPEDSLHGFDLIKMYPEDLRSDLPVLPSHAAIRMEQSSPAVTARSAVNYIVEHYQKEVRGYLEKEAKTLWEIWRFLLNLTDGKRLDINQVRQNLSLASYGLIETMVPTCSVVSDVSDTAGAKRNDADSIHSESDAENSDKSLASSDLDTPDYLGDNKSLSVDSAQRRPRTFDGLYVREPCVDGANMEVYRDTSKGREVRMSRRKGLFGDITAGAKMTRTKSVAAAHRCSCSQAHFMSVDLSELTLCGEKGCLLPHLLVYRLDRKTENSVGIESSSATSTAAVVGLPPRSRTPINKNNTTSAKPKADVFYWGTSLAPVTVPVAVTSETQKSQTQTQSQQPMSQLRFHLSQFSQASQQPASQTSLMSQEMPKPLSQSQALTPAARTPAPLPEVSLDVTDNILAVLGNQWNRSLEHTAFIDPARSSLVQAFLP